jgi:hypothetical protein
VPTFNTAEKPNFALVRGSQLPEPPLGDVVAAPRALHFGSRQGRDVFVTVDDGKHLLTPQACLLQSFVIPFHFPYKSTFSALQLAPRGDHQPLAMRAEHHPFIIEGEP